MKKSKYYVRILVMLLLFLCSLFLQAEPAFAKRGEPAVIPDIIYKDLRITAENSTIDTMGIVEAYDKNTGKLVWSTKVYDVIIFPLIESDVQYVFFKDMKIENDKLVITDERERVYRLNPMTGKGRLRFEFVLVVPTVLIITGITLILLHLTKRKRDTGKHSNKSGIS